MNTVINTQLAIKVFVVANSTCMALQLESLAGWLAIANCLTNI